MNKELTETEKKILSGEPEYKRINNIAVKITESTTEKTFMLWIYDVKNFLWRDADITANSVQECINIAEIIFEDYFPDYDKELNINIDYGAE